MAAPGVLSRTKCGGECDDGGAGTIHTYGMTVLVDQMTRWMVTASESADYTAGI